MNQLLVNLKLTVYIGILVGLFLLKYVLFERDKTNKSWQTYRREQDSCRPPGGYIHGGTDICV